MTKKEYLQQYIDTVKLIDAKNEEIKKYKEMATKTTSSLTPDKIFTQSEDKISKIVANIVDMQREIVDKIEDLHKIKRKIEKSIDAVDDPTMRTLLELRYIHGYSFEQIAVEIHYCWRQVIRIHGHALQRITMS